MTFITDIDKQRYRTNTWEAWFTDIEDGIIIPTYSTYTKDQLLLHLKYAVNMNRSKCINMILDSLGVPVELTMRERISYIHLTE